MGVAGSITNSHSSSEDPYLIDEDYECGRATGPHEWMWGSGTRPRRLPSRTPTPSESSFVAPKEEDTEEEDGEWVSRAEADHARWMAVALQEDEARIQKVEQKLMRSQELEHSSQAMADMMEETIAELSCKLVDIGIELSRSRELVNVLVAMLVLLCGVVLARFLAR